MQACASAGDVARKIVALNVEPRSRMSCDVAKDLGGGREDLINESKLDMIYVVGVVLDHCRGFSFTWHLYIIL